VLPEQTSQKNQEVTSERNVVSEKDVTSEKDLVIEKDFVTEKDLVTKKDVTSVKEVASEKNIAFEKEVTSASEKEVVSESQATKKPGFCESLSSSKYSRGTWMCIMVALFNQLTGINAVSLYSTTIFEQIQESSESGGFSPIFGTSLVGISMFVGCLLGPLVQALLKIRAIFIVGQVLMGLCLLIVGVSIQVQGPPLATLIPILLFLCVYQATQGSFFWFYVG